jgi:glyoxylase-like metal-dependent hydrolase (beta-lactamase superfamily II)
MPDVTEVAPDVYRFEVPIAGMPQVPVTYLINAAGGALIEPGPAAAAPAIRQAMARLGMRGLSCIIPTHIHVDHGGGTGTLSALFPEARVVVHPRGVKHLVAPQRLIESTRLVWGQDFEKQLGPIVPVPESRLKVARDGEIIRLGDRELKVIHAVGHSPNHIVILDCKVNGLFCGEALGLPGHQFPPVAPYSFDQDIYVSTIQSLMQMQLDLLFYSHGTVETDAGRAMSRALENARVYGTMILEAARRGTPLEEIMGLVGDDFSLRFGQPATGAEVEIAVAGYVIYFKSKGMLA